MIRPTGGTVVRRHPTSGFVLVMVVSTLLATMMHGRRGFGRCLSAAPRYA